MLKNMANQKVQLTAPGKSLPLLQAVAFSEQESPLLSRLLLTALPGKNSPLKGSAKILHKIAQKLKISSNLMAGGVCGMAGGVCFWAGLCCFLAGGLNFLTGNSGFLTGGADCIAGGNNLAAGWIGFWAGGFGIIADGLSKIAGGNGSPKTDIF